MLTRPKVRRAPARVSVANRAVDPLATPRLTTPRLLGIVEQIRRGRRGGPGRPAGPGAVRGGGHRRDGRRRCRHTPRRWPCSSRRSGTGRWSGSATSTRTGRPRPDWSGRCRSARATCVPRTSGPRRCTPSRCTGSPPRCGTIARRTGPRPDGRGRRLTAARRRSAAAAADGADHGDDQQQREGGAERLAQRSRRSPVGAPASRTATRPTSSERRRRRTRARWLGRPGGAAASAGAARRSSRLGPRRPSSADLPADAPASDSSPAAATGLTVRRHRGAYPPAGTASAGAGRTVRCRGGGRTRTPGRRSCRAPTACGRPRAAG